MASEIVINATLPEIRIALLEDGEITDLSTEYEKNKSTVGNIYKGRVTRVLPGMQAAFVDIGLERAAFLYVGDVFDHFASFQDNRSPEKEEREATLPIEFDATEIIEDKNLTALEDGQEEEEESEENIDAEEDDDHEEQEEATASPTQEQKPETRRPRARSYDHRRRRNFIPNIQDVLREGQHVLVQVTKEQIGKKGARLSCNVSLPGRNVVLMPTVDHVGVSRKIESYQERRRLRDVIENLRPPGMGFIVRTSAAGQSNDQIVNEVNYLLSLWSKVKQKAEKAKVPALLQEDLNVVLKTVRDNFTDDIYRLVIDSPRVHAYVQEFIEQFAPHLKNRVVRYTGKDPIFDAYGIESEITRALSRKVWLKSGGYLIIDQAEALTVVDVNTGKFIGKSTLEDTIVQTNLEAVKEVAYQLRLRNVGGIIIIDLIDMEKSQHREKVYHALEEALQKDRAKTNILKISELGLIQMTRKRTKESLNNVLCEPCPYCEGRGFTKNLRTICFDIFREIERLALEGGNTGATIIAHPEVADALFHEERDTLDRLEERFGLKISLRGNPAFHLETFRVEAERLSFRPSVQQSTQPTTTALH